MKLTVIGGGGWIGSPTAFHIATLGLAKEIVLIGGRTHMAEQHALDMSTAVSMLDVTVRAGGYQDMAGSDLVINTAGVPHTGDIAEMLAKNTVLLREIAGEIRAYCPQALVITATNPVDPLNYATWLAGGFARRQVIGYSLNDSLRFRQFVAKAKGVEVSRVEGTVIGEHGPTQVPLFSSVRIDGLPVGFTEAEKQAVRDARPEMFKRIEVLQKETGRTAGWTCAVGLAKLTAAIAGDTGEIFPMLGGARRRIRPAGPEHGGAGANRAGRDRGDPRMGPGRRRAGGVGGLRAPARGGNARSMNLWPCDEERSRS